MLKVGVTGNIGSGKTIVCKVFELLNIDVYYADDKAKQFLDYEEVKIKVRRLFGSEIFDHNGKIVKHKLADIVFNNRYFLEQLNNIIHPLVKEDFKKWAERRESQPYVLQEAAIIFEAGFDASLHKVIVVASNDELMIKRAMLRDRVPVEAVKSRLTNQMEQQSKIDRADYLITNNEKQLVIPQVIDLHNMLLAV